MPLPKYIVHLTAEERFELDDLIRTGKRTASVLIHARILLKADTGAAGSGWDDDRIAEAVECGASTVYRVRRAFVEEGLPAVLFRKKPTGRHYRKFVGASRRRTGRELSNFGFSARAPSNPRSSDTASPLRPLGVSRTACAPPTRGCRSTRAPLDGAQEARLIALACGAPPDGRATWTLRLLADRLIELDVVEAISPECVRMTLKKTHSSHGCANSG